MRTTRLGAAAGRPRRMGASARKICGSVRAQRDRPGAAREFTYLAEAPLPHDPNLTLPLPIPALEPPLALHQRIALSFHEVHAERRHRWSHYISWNMSPLLLFELVPKDGGQFDQIG